MTLFALESNNRYREHRQGSKYFTQTLVLPAYRDQRRPSRSFGYCIRELRSAVSFINLSVAVQKASGNRQRGHSLGVTVRFAPTGSVRELRSNDSSNYVRLWSMFCIVHPQLLPLLVSLAGLEQRL